jgi:class 3 adenylate cyclase
MDPRGIGCSDRLPPGRSATLEEKVDDVIAVLAASSSFNATIFGGGQSAFTALLAAATHPDRVAGLILFAASPGWVRSEELPWQDSVEELERILDQYRRNWSSQEWASSWTRRFAPTLPEPSARAIGSYNAVTIAKGGGIAEEEMHNRVDLLALLPTIRVPTLVLHRTDDPLEPIESGRLVAERIPGAKLLELPGRDALPWIGEADAVLEAIELFLTGERRTPQPDRVLATVLFTDIVDSTSLSAAMGDRAWSEILARHDRIVRDEVQRGRGRVIKAIGDGYLATFDGPARAISSAVAIAGETAELGIEIRSGVHTGEIEFDGEDIAGIGVTIGARIGALAGASEVLVSQTVRDLVAGAGLKMEDAGEHELKGVPDRWRLFRVLP